MILRPLEFKAYSLLKRVLGSLGPAPLRVALVGVCFILVVPSF